LEALWLLFLFSWYKVEGNANFWKLGKAIKSGKIFKGKERRRRKRELLFNSRFYWVLLGFAAADESPPL
jgi:hypothetical protein